MATYLQLVNNVLVRLRETEVASVTTSDYSKLIGRLVNDAKKTVENSFTWDSLYTTITFNTSDGVSNYTLTGSGLTLRDVNVYNNTQDNVIYNKPLAFIIREQLFSTTANQEPTYYAFNGNDGTDSKIEMYPTPNAAYSIVVTGYKNQTDLTADSDVLLVHPHLVELRAYALAIVERGENGGLHSGEANVLYTQALADYIAIESSRYVENDCWEAV